MKLLGVASLGDLRELGRIGGKTVAYYRRGVGPGGGEEAGTHRFLRRGEPYFDGHRQVDDGGGSLRRFRLDRSGGRSSNATLPVTIKVAENELGVSTRVAGFVLPLGATVNMDGTALYQGVAVMFIAQVFGIDLHWTTQLTVVLTATLASIGAAGVPSSGIITLALVLRQAKVPETGIALILGVDRILDMLRTAVNVTGDLSAVVFVARTEGELVVPADGEPAKEMAG